MHSANFVGGANGARSFGRTQQVSIYMFDASLKMILPPLYGSTATLATERRNVEDRTSGSCLSEASNIRLIGYRLPLRWSAVFARGKLPVCTGLVSLS